MFKQRSQIAYLHHHLKLRSANYFILKKFLEEINDFIQQGCIKLIKSDSKDMYNVTKDCYFK